MPTLTINMVTCLKNIRKAWDKRQLAVQHSDYVGSNFIDGPNRHGCAFAYAFGWKLPENDALDKKQGIIHAAINGNRICRDLVALEDAHFRGPEVFRKCLVRMEKKYGVR